MFTVITLLIVAIEVSLVVVLSDYYVEQQAVDSVLKILRKLGRALAEATQQAIHLGLSQIFGISIQYTKIIRKCISSPLRKSLYKISMILWEFHQTWPSF